MTTSLLQKRPTFIGLPQTISLLQKRPTFLGLPHISFEEKMGKQMASKLSNDYIAFAKEPHIHRALFQKRPTFIGLPHILEGKMRQQWRVSSLLITSLL